MANIFHKDFTLDNNHALPARVYADVTARDADTAFHITANLNKMVRVDSPISYFVLSSIGPAVFVEVASATAADVIGPASATDNALVRFDTTTGKLIQNSVAILTDAGALTGLTSLKLDDSVLLLFGTGSDAFIRADGANFTINNTEGELRITQGAVSAGDIVIDNTANTADTILRLGTDTDATALRVQNNSVADLLTVLGDGKTGFGISSGLTHKVEINDSLNQLKLSGAVVQMEFSETDASVDNKIWRWEANAEEFRGRIINDALSVGTNWIEVNRTGTTIDSVQFPNGDVGIGITPASPLHVFVNNADTLLTHLTLEQDGTGDVIVDFLLTGIVRWAVGVDNTDADKFKFASTGGLASDTRLTIEPVNGHVGIGETNPDVRLHVEDGASGVGSSPAGTVLRVESSINTFLSLFSPDANARGIYFGEPSNSIAGGIVYNSEVADGIGWRTAGTGTKMVLTAPGDLGLGINPPDNRFHLFENTALGGATAGMTIEQAGSGDAILHFEEPFQIFSIGAEQEDDIFVIAPGTVLTPNPNYFAMDNQGRAAIGNATPQPGAALSIHSTTLGFLPPRMTRTQLDAIASNFAGMQGHNSSTNIPSYFSGSKWLPMADPTNVISITSQTDWNDLVSGGTITIASDTTILLKTFIVTADEIVVNSGVNFSLLGGDIANAGIFYTGAGTFITSDGFDVMRIFGIGFLSGNSTGTLFNVTNGGTFFRVQSMGIFDWAGLGTISNSAVFEVINAGIFDTGSKLILDDVANIALDGANFTNFVTDTSDSLIQIKSTKLADIAVTVTLTTTQLKPLESLLELDPAVGDLSTFVINNNTLSGTVKALFDAGGSTGTFTAVADASVGATSITSVTDSSGVARFNFTVGPTLFVNQKVVISTFVTNTAYNGTFIITATGAGFFEVSSIAFGSNETGSFLSDSVTLTDTATTLVDGDTLTIDTDLATDYDGGAIVYNKLTNSFRINRTFTATQTGTWDTGSLDQESMRILSFLNPGIGDSKYIACAHVNDNSTANGTIVNNTFTDVVFGTAGTALVESTTAERWKLVDEINGIFEYMGNEPFEGYITFDFTVESSGGTVDFRFKWQIDTGSGFGDLPDDVEALVAVGSDALSVTKTFPLAAVIGDQIKPQITRNSGGSGITTTYATVYATQ